RCKISRRAELDRHRSLGWKPCIDKGDPIRGHRRGYSVALESLRSPELFACLRIVRNDQLIAAGYKLSLLRTSHDQRCSPACLNLSSSPPHFLAGLLIQRGNERLLAAVFVTLQYHRVLEQHRRRARAHPERGNLAWRGLPYELAVEVIAVQTF